MADELAAHGHAVCVLDERDIGWGSTAASTATPCRRTRDTHPENTPPSTAPTGIAANSHANAKPPPSGPPNDSCAIWGNSERGMPNTIAMRSTTKLASRTG